MGIKERIVEDKILRRVEKKQDEDNECYRKKGFGERPSLRLEVMEI